MSENKAPLCQGSFEGICAAYTDLQARLAAAESYKADAERYRHLKASGAFRVFSVDMSGRHLWGGVGRPIGEGSNIDEAVDGSRGASDANNR